VLGAVIIAVAAALLQPLSCRPPGRPSPSRARSPGRVERANPSRMSARTALMAPAAGQLPRLRRRRCPRRRPAIRHVGQGPRRAHVHRGFPLVLELGARGKRGLLLIRPETDLGGGARARRLPAGAAAARLRRATAWRTSWDAAPSGRVVCRN